MPRCIFRLPFPALDWFPPSPPHHTYPPPRSPARQTISPPHFLPFLTSSFPHTVTIQTHHTILNPLLITLSNPPSISPIPLSQRITFWSNLPDPYLQWLG